MNSITHNIMNSGKRSSIYGLLTKGKLFHLFHALLFILIIFPYLETSQKEQSPLLLTLTNVIVICAIIYVIRTSVKQLIIGLFLGVPTLILCWIHLPQTQKIALFLTTLLYIYAIFLLIVYLLRKNEVGSEEIFGAISLYFMLGITWSTIYSELEWIYPNSLQLTSQPTAHLGWSDYLFFSFTTLTTLGYGDIIPVTSNSRSWAIIEASTGVIFLTVMVSRIIGLSLSIGVCNILKNQETLKTQPTSREKGNYLD